MENDYGSETGVINSTIFSLRGGLEVRINDLTAVVHAAEEGGYWAEVPALPGCLTEADTLDELVVNLNDAIEGWLSAQTFESLTALGVNYKPVKTLMEAAKFQQTGSDAPSSRLPKFDGLRFAV